MTKRRAILLGIVVLGAVVFFGWTLFRFILNDELSQAARSADIPRINRLLSRGADINGRGMHGMTALMSACAGGDVATVRHLIGRGADVNGHNVSGSALMWAIESGNPNVVSFLLEHNADVAWKNHLGQDARSFAHEKGDQDIIDLLK